MKINKYMGRQTLLLILLVILLVLAFVPIVLMIVLSMKSNAQIYGNFWSLPNSIAIENYQNSLKLLYGNMINTVFVVAVATLFTVALSAMSGYVFAKLSFPGKEFLFMAVLAMMMVPSILTLTPKFKLMETFHLLNTRWVLILKLGSRRASDGYLALSDFYERTADKLVRIS